MPAISRTFDRRCPTTATVRTCSPVPPPTTAAVLAVAASGSRVEPGSTRGGSVTPSAVDRPGLELSLSETERGQLLGATEGALGARQGAKL
jgi:hypothetical protein